MSFSTVLVLIVCCDKLQHLQASPAIEKTESQVKNKKKIKKSKACCVWAFIKHAGDDKVKGVNT